MTGRTALVPPRPNPGPEPWPEPDAAIGPAWSVALALVVGWAVGWTTARKRPRPKGDPLDRLRRLVDAADDDSGASDEAFAAQARDLLAEALGDVWRARTTEEIADDPGLADRIGPDRRAALLERLKRGDTARFGGSGGGC